MSSVPVTAVDLDLDLDLDPAGLAELCPRVRPAPGPGPVVTGPVLGRCRALVRVHVAVGADDGRPLRHSADPRARVLPLAAGAATVVLAADAVHAHLDDGDLAGHDVSLSWAEVDDVGPAAGGGVRLLSTRLLGALTVDVVGWLLDPVN